MRGNDLSLCHNLQPWVHLSLLVHLLCYLFTPFLGSSLGCLCLLATSFCPCGKGFAVFDPH